MSHIIYIEQSNLAIAVQTLKNYGVSFMVGTDDHSESPIVRVYGGIGQLDYAERIIREQAIV